MTPGMRMSDYAFVSAWDNRLQTLARLAEPERWTYRSVPDASPLPILDAYVRHTFERICDQGKLAESARFSCFNTGLITPDQEEIFGLFHVSEHFNPAQPQGPGNKKWYLSRWITAGDRRLTDFPEPPRLATFWDDPAELVFNPQLHVQLNLDHIVRDNLRRFPVELGGQLGLDGVPLESDAETDTAEDDIENGGENGRDDDAIEEPATVGIPLAIRNAVEGAMKHSIRLALRNYRMAVPQYHRGAIQLLLPLYLRNPHRPDLVLTLARQGDWYRATTIIYPDWAYQHARVLGRPNSEWLGGFRSDLSAD